MQYVAFLNSHNSLQEERPTCLDLQKLHKLKYIMYDAAVHERKQNVDAISLASRKYAFAPRTACQQYHLLTICFCQPKFE